MNTPAAILKGKVICADASDAVKDFVMGVKAVKGTGTPKVSYTLHTDVTAYVAERYPFTTNLDPELNLVNDVVIDSSALPVDVGVTVTV